MKCLWCFANIWPDGIAKGLACFGIEATNDEHVFAAKFYVQALGFDFNIALDRFGWGRILVRFRRPALCDACGEFAGVLNAVPGGHPGAGQFLAVGF